MDSGRCLLQGEFADDLMRTKGIRQLLSQLAVKYLSAPSKAQDGTTEKRTEKGEIIRVHGKYWMLIKSIRPNNVPCIQRGKLNVCHGGGVAMMRLCFKRGLKLRTTNQQPTNNAEVFSRKAFKGCRDAVLTSLRRELSQDSWIVVCPPIPCTYLQSVFNI